ncbi:sacsin N-terminal ATP-binding-like domain-containing protein [Nocardioides marmoribigeumensis]|uniref:DUF3883 domain-containing protein n=1 Tax=Nocardioides marmoribigeumensis TaxID=433649 RepID=A0ABU2BRY2_9ACTN|nr:hypothetical protein [Nocardioides marmoribigeumensis]MDR7361383.1 hypothetical protein [Nocardioides marmoribigeumensis]
MLPTPEFRALIEKKAAWPVEQYLHGRRNGELPTLQVKRFIEGIISADYHGRTLIELIQNAHDAHPKGSEDGQIRILLDETEGACGTLYVANGGLPLSEANFNAIVSVALSDKPPSEGIGNKGVGFKSVLQFSDRPEVYSKAAPESHSFDGFTFRFGEPEDFERVANGIDADAAELADNISTLTLTFPLESAPVRVVELGAVGFCTVIRLPLKSRRALANARGELDEVSGSDVPLHLFLDRIETIEIQVVGDDAPDPVSLTRLVDDLAPSHGVSTALLQDGSEFIVARRTVAERKVLDAITATREAGAHLPGWDAWKGDAEVVFALSAGDSLESPRLYNFLPMGEQVTCPLPAYLQAPFFSSLNRRSLDEDYPINALFLDEAAELAADLLVAATEGDLDLPDGTLVDVACWSVGSLTRLKKALTLRSRSLDEMPILPSRVPGSRVSVAKGSLWQPVGKRFSPERLEAEQLGVLVSPHLGADRLTRVERLAFALGLAETWKPTRPMLVSFAETCAAGLLRENVKAKVWAKFYDELAVGLPGHTGLAGARIVIGADGLLAANGAPGQPTVFFPPARGDIGTRRQPPAAVTGRLAYVRDDIPWKRDQSNRPGKEWLGGCVAEFGTEDILKVVAEVMDEADLTDEGLAQALLYALDVWRQARSPLGEESFPTTPFRVPTRSGWISADAAFFGRGWGGEEEWVDDALARLLRETGDVPELRAVSESVVLAPEDWLDDPSLRELMRTFLERAGVVHGLWPVEPAHTPWKQSGHLLNHPATIAPAQLPFWVTAEIRAQWLGAADKWTREKATYTGVPYDLVSNAMLPGQLDWPSFSLAVRDVYGELVLAGLDRWEDDVFDAVFYRRASADRCRWPSFLTTFLVSEAWFPQREPNDRTTPSLVKLTEAWWVSEDLPSYLPSAATHLRRVIGPTAVTRLRRLGLRHWDAADAAVDRIDHLADLIAAAGSWVRGTRAEYERSWLQHLAQTESGSNTRRPRGVLVEREAQVEIADLTADGEPVYYAVPDLPQASLLAYVPLARLGFSDRQLSKRVGDFLASTVSPRFRSVADAEIAVRFTDPALTGPVLEVIGDWLETLVLLVLSHQQGIARRTDRQLERTALDLRTTRIALVDTFSTSVAGHEVEETTRHMSCFVEQDDGTGLVLVRGGSGQSRVKLAEIAAEGICQAIGASGVFKDLRLALIDLQSLVQGGTPSLSDLADALGLHLADVEIANAERGGIRPDLSVLVAVLATVAPELAEELRESSHDDDRAELEIWLRARLGASTGADAAALLGYADSGRVWGPVEDGIVTLADANAGLKLLGFEPLSNGDAHGRAFSHYLASRRSALLDELRDRFAERVAADPAAMASYVELTGLPELHAEPSWAEEFWHLPPEIMATHTDDWLERVAGPPASSSLPPVEELRGRPLTQPLTTSRDSVLTWCELNQATVPAPIDVASVAAQIRSSGFLDFAERTSEELVGWLHEHGYWPHDMPRTLSQKDLGITQDDLKQARERRRAAAEDEKRRKSAIEYGGDTFTGEPDDLLRLDEAIASRLSVASLGSLPTLASLNELSERSPKDPSKPTKPIRASSPPPEKIQNIGLAGELFAAHWIEANFGLLREETWCSGYRNDILGGLLGDDSLGYDFSVPMGEVTYLIEVKASTGDDTIFSLPEVEITRALDLAPHEQYTILFVANVLTDELRTFMWLPNPLGSQARLFRREGRQMKFRFDLANG